MSKVLTWEEYETLAKETKINPIQIEGKVPDVVTPIQAESSEEYYLMFPDNPVDRYHNGSYHIDENITLEIINGIVMTDNLEIKNKLVKQGFLFLQKKEKKDEQ